MSFSVFPILRATARHRVVVSYAVDPERVASQLPAGLRPDTRDGRAYVRLVGVHLVGTRVLGVSVPGLRRVPAVELQVLVQRDRGAPDDRGVFTVQADVPRRLVAWAARGLYGEPVSVTSMQPVWKERADEVELTYRFDRAGREQRIRVVGEKPLVTPASDAPVRFLRDRHWRYSVVRDGTLCRARLDHTRDVLYSTREQYVTVRWGTVYGDDWAFLDDRAPSVVFCDPGGPIALHWRERVSW